MAHSFPIRVIEFFAGIGGFKTAWPECEVVAAYDINRICQQIYASNYRSPYHAKEIASLRCAELNSLEADFWWLSPPCQPFTTRGRQRDLDDPRCDAFKTMFRLISQCQPHALVLENVVGFLNSRAMQAYRELLSKEGYRVEVLQVCPSQFGWPNRRPRIYVLAARDPTAILDEEILRLQERFPLRLHLRQFLQPAADTESIWRLGTREVAGYHSALDRVSRDCVNAITACFAASYGKTILQSGSYLESAGGYRRFTPREVARLLGFPDRFSLEGHSARNLWRVLGNSLSIVAVRRILHCFRFGPADNSLDLGPCFSPPDEGQH